MTTDQAILFALFALVFAGLLWGRWRYDLVAFVALLAGVVLGVVPKDAAFSGFGHPATVIVALVLVVSAGLVRSGAVLLITRTFIDTARGLGSHIAIMGSIGAVLSAFMNNVAALALLMPVDVATARKAGRAPGLSLMPLSFATILGGMVTLIGTPPNIIIAAIREETIGTTFAMFDFAPVGGVVAIAGIAFVALFGWRLIRVSEPPKAAADDLDGFIAELVIPKKSPLIGQRLSELTDEAEKADIAIIGLARGGKRLYGTARNRVLEAGDDLIIEALPEAIDEFRTALKLDYADDKRIAHIEGEGMTLVEVVVPEGARIEGRTAIAVGLAWRQRSILLGIRRGGKPIRTRVRQTKVHAGDILLILAPSESAHDVAAWLGTMPLAERGADVTQGEKTWAAIGIFAAAVAAAAFGWLYMPIALGVVVAAYILTGIITLREVYTLIEWPVVVLLGSMIPLGAALDASGGTALIAGGLTTLTDGYAPWVALTVLMIVTMTLSDVLNNTATTIVAAPVGIEMARTMGVSPDPFLMAVAVAASCAFLTPIGHKNNTLILGPGGYGFGDYWRMGLPLEVLVVAVSIPAILVFWPM